MEISTMVNSYNNSFPSNQTSQNPMLIDDVIKLFFYSFLILFAVFGNSFVLFVLYRKRKQFNFWRVNLFIFHLALGDILVALTSMPVNLLYASTNGAWLLGNNPCKVMAFIQVVAPSSTSFLIVSMALDRYRAVINASRSSKQIYVMIAGSWGLSLLLSCPQLYGWGTFDQNGEEVCGAKADWLSSSAFQMYMIIIFILILVIPTSANCFCYGKIIKKLFYDPQKREEREEEVSHVNMTSSLAVEANQTAAPSMGVPGGGAREINSFTVTERIRAARIRTTKLAMLIVMFYNLCWLPYFIVSFVLIFSPYQVSNRVLDVVEGLAMVNSCINPLVYGKYTFKQSDVEHAFKCLQPGTARRVVQCLGIVGSTDSESRNQTYDQHFAMKLQIYRQQRANLQNGVDKPTST